MRTREKASQPAKGARKVARKAARATKKPAAKNAKKTPASERCAAVTQKGTQCRLKPQEGSTFCARHQEAVTGPAREKPERRSAAVVPAAKNGSSKPKARQDRAPARTPVPAAEPETATAADGPTPKDEETTAPEEPHTDLYGSEWSSTLEASPYDDVTPEMASGEDEVELVDESEMGRDARRRRFGGRGREQGRPQQARPPQPRLSREEAEAQALKKLGARPEIAPEEDLNEELANYDQRFEAEVRNLMGLERRRGRRGGRRRRGRGGGQPGPGGPQQGGQGGGGPQQHGRKRRGRRGGRRRRGDDQPQGQGDGPTRRARPVGRRSGPGPGSKVARDSPLAKRRPSSGPKRGTQPRRRREPDF